MRDRESSMGRWTFAALFLLVAAAARADVVELKDGRRFEGKITALDDRRVVIDTKVLETRVKIGFPRVDVANVVEKELAPGYFDPPRAEPRVSDPRKFSEDQTLYLEVPIIGEIGKDVFAAGISSVLNYAKAHGIQHLVFRVDSVGGDFDEGVAIYRLLRANREGLVLHGIVQRARGPAIALGLWCNSTHLLPGGVIGGLDKLPEKSAVVKTTAKGNPDDSAEEDRILRAQIANRVISDTKKTGLVAQVVRALLDPHVSLVVWRDAEGQIDYGPQAPPGTPPEKVLLEAPEGKPLELTPERLVALGARPFQGEATDLGSFLGLKGWTPESDFGHKTMTRVAAEKQKKMQAKEAAQEARIQKNVGRRQETHDYLGNCIQQAAQWDPRKGEYEKYSQDWGWGWAGGTAAHWTKDSQAQWKTRTDAAAHYLIEAQKSLRTLKKLDAEAVKLGLEPTLKPGEADTMLKDMEVKLAALASQRGKKSN